MHKYQSVKISDLIPYANNARTHSESQITKIASSIKEFGFINPVIIDNGHGIIAGHGRVLAAQKLGLDEIPCLEVSTLTKAQKKAYILADNRLALDAGWDNELLKIEFEELKDLDFDLELTGFTVDELDLYTAPEIPAGLTDEDSAPEAPDESVTKIGDIWILGNHRLMCGDSTSIDEIEKLMNGEKADLLFTDPPYNQNTDGGCKGKIGKALRNQGKEIEHICDFNPADFLQIIPHLFYKSMNAYIFCNKDLVLDYLLEAKNQGYSQNILVWKKPNSIPIGGSFRPDVEYIITFRKSAIFNSSLSDVSYSKVLNFDRVKNKVHPTMKPVELIENQLRISSNNKSKVVDLFGGSGSTLIACEKIDRNARLMEIDPKYCDVIINRWQDYTGKKAVHESLSKTFDELKNES